ncbi:MAG: substrate-binding domain-containing protein [Candidatus Omnitrophota bacterium]|jgi:phosphate transport system substrate-binding protein
MRGKFFAFVFLTFFTLITFGAYAADDEILIEGPEKMAKFAEPWVEKFRQDEPGVAIRFAVCTAREGFTDLSLGECDIVINVSRPQDIFRWEESKVNKTVVAAEGVVFVVNPQNPVDKLTMSELADILSGETINWEDVGGAFGEITVYGPPANSWVNDFVEESILSVFSPSGKKNIAYRVNDFLSNAEIRQQVAVQPLALGYYPGTYVPAGLKMLSVASPTSGEYFTPVKDKMLDARYPVQRPVFFWTSGSNPAVRMFIERVLSRDYQEMLSAYGFYPAAANDKSE